jgi:hypothetical protein
MSLSAAGKPNCSRKRVEQKGDEKEVQASLARSLAGNRLLWPSDSIKFAEATMTQCTIERQPDCRKLKLGTACRLAAAITTAALALAFSGCGKQTEQNNVAVKNEAPPVAESPLAKAAIQGDLAEIKALLEAGADINSRDALGRTPLHMAAFYGRLKTTELLIASGADINVKDRVEMTPLHAAVLSGGRQEVELLLLKKAQINAKSDAGQTPLHLAAATGQPKLSKFLIERGADPQSKDVDGKTPLFYAERNKHPQTTALLQQYRAKE